MRNASAPIDVSERGKEVLFSCNPLLYMRVTLSITRLYEEKSHMYILRVRVNIPLHFSPLPYPLFPVPVGVKEFVAACKGFLHSWILDFFKRLEIRKIYLRHVFGMYHNR
jgi:hypothetical protein